MNLIVERESQESRPALIKFGCILVSVITKKYVSKYHDISYFNTLNLVLTVTLMIFIRKLPQGEECSRKFNCSGLPFGYFTDIDFRDSSMLRTNAAITLEWSLPSCA